jgi:hypothetical protein
MGPNETAPESIASTEGPPARAERAHLCPPDEPSTSSTVESLLDLSGMPADEPLGIMKDLRLRGIVVLGEGIQEL